MGDRDRSRTKRKYLYKEIITTKKRIYQSKTGVCVCINQACASLGGPYPTSRKKGRGLMRLSRVGVGGLVLKIWTVVGGFPIRERLGVGVQ